MGDLTKLKVAIGQIEYIEGAPSANGAESERMVERALDAGADLLVLPNSLVDGDNVRIIGLNDSRIDIAGNVVVLEACGEVYRIGVGSRAPGCDFTVSADLAPYTLAPRPARAPEEPGTARVVVRPVGMRDCGKTVLAYDGGSAVYGADGSLLARLSDDFTEDFAVVSLAEAGEVAPPCDAKPLTALVATMRRFDELVLGGRMPWVIGLSGGLDSSVVAALLVLAFGADRVAAYNLATRFNSDATKSNAAQVAANLGVPLRNGSIEDLVVAVGNTLVGYGYPIDALKDVVLENVQARTRGNLLATFAAVEGGVVVNNGNRVECALGYATLYGDAIGALSPIGDITKVNLFDIARDANRIMGAEVVPENLLPVESPGGLEWQTMPSAELASGQRDPMKWFYHDWLVEQLVDGPGTLEENACDLLERHAADRLASSGAAKWVRYYGMDDPRAFADDLQWVLDSMRRSAFKRIQAPPVIAVASPASTAPRAETQAPAEPSARFAQLMVQSRR